MGLFDDIGKGLGVAFPVATAGTALLGAISGGLDMIGANQDRKSAEGIANQQHADRLADMEMQREFAKNGIRWRVEDAVAAGLHPMAALGASGAQYNSPGLVVGGDPGPGESFRAAGRMGQNISRAVMATATPEERELRGLQVQRARLENEMLGVQLIDAQDRLADKVGPALPSYGSPGYWGPLDLRRTHSQGVDVHPSLQASYGSPGMEAAVIPDAQWASTPVGGMARVPSEAMSQRLQGHILHQLEWAWRNRVMDMMGMLPGPDKKFLPPGHKKWVNTNFPAGQYLPMKSGSWREWFTNRFGKFGSIGAKRR